MTNPSGNGDPAEIELTARLWRELLEIDARFHDQKNIRLLTPEARVLIHLKLNGPMPVTSAMQVAGTSHRGFYTVLDRLRQAGAVGTVRDEQDQRVRRLNLDSSSPIQPMDS
jgi:DNA-binding MarR family transcriptional regulator